MLLLITVDYQEASAGGATFEILTITDDAGNDFKHLIGYDERFCSFAEVSQHIGKLINLAAEEIEIEEI